MRKMLILGGNTNKNILWIEEMKDRYSDDYDVSVVRYDNWYNDKRIDIDREVLKISDIVKDKDIDIVVAKSIGMLLCVLAIQRKIILPKMVIFMGYPMKFFEEERINILDDLIDISIKIRTLFIQQINDPQCSFKELEEVLDNRVSIVGISGNDHAYNEFGIIKKYIDEFIKIDV